MTDVKEFNFLLRKKLKNLSKNSPVFFKYYVDFKKNKINIFIKSTATTNYSFDIDYSKKIDLVIREIYLTLFEREYPRLESHDGNVYVIDKVNIFHNIILMKKLNDPDSDETYGCKLKIPVIMFIRDYCSKEFDLNPKDRWNIYISQIDSIYRGDNIYKA